MRIPKQVSLTKSLALTISLVLLVSGIVYVLAAAPSSTFWLTPGVYPGAPSFTVWREGNNYFAKNANGELAFFSGSTNASYVINSASEDLGYPTSGGIVFLKSGIFVTDSPIVVHSGVTLKGEGAFYPSSVFQPNIIGTVLRATHSGYVVTCGNISALSETKITSFATNVLDLLIDGNNVATVGVYFKGNLQSTIKNVFIDRVDGDGVVLDVKTQVVWVRDSRMMNLAGRAIVCLYADNFILNNDVTSTGDCISIGNSSYSVNTNVVSGNLVRSSGGKGFYIRGADNMITNNRADNCFEHGFYVAIGGRNTFTGNTAWANGKDTEGTYAGFFDASHVSTWTGNTAYSTSQDRGFEFAGNQTTATGNVAANGAIGFYVYCDWGSFCGNIAESNTGVGFQITSYGERNIIIGQISVDNGGIDILDAGSDNEVHLCYNGTTWIP